MQENKTSNVFTYGSLMFDEVWRKIVVGKYQKMAATLYGYTRMAVRNEDYPAVVKGNSQSTVNGIVYKNVSLEDIRKLDNFEGEYYSRQMAQVLATGNYYETVAFYLLRPQFSYLLAEREWDQESFEKIGIQKFLEQYVGFNYINN